MRRLIATGLLVAFLFNLIGYYGVYYGLRERSNRELKERLDRNDFSAEETMTIKVPLAIPYQSDWNDFQRIDGDFEKDNQFYNLVAQKLERDTLTFIVIRDHHEAGLFESMADFVHASTDTPAAGKTVKAFNGFEKDFLVSISRLASASAGWISTSTFNDHSYPLITVPGDVSYPPPRT